MGRNTTPTSVNGTHADLMGLFYFLRGLVSKMALSRFHKESIHRKSHKQAQLEHLILGTMHFRQLGGGSPIRRVAALGAKNWLLGNRSMDTNYQAKYD